MAMGSVGGAGGAMMGGGAGAVGGSSAAGGAAPLNFGGLNGPVGQTGIHASGSVQLQQLAQLLNGFSSAEILMALMLAAASGNHKKHSDGSDGAMALLAGLAMAQQLGVGASGMMGGCNCNPGVSAPAGGACGAGLNALA